MLPSTIAFLTITISVIASLLIAVVVIYWAKTRKEKREFEKEHPDDGIDWDINWN